MCLKTVKLASCKYLDGLPQEGNKHGQAFRDVYWEERIKKLCQDLGVGAQYGGKYFVHDVRVVRLPRHGASCPVGIGVSCSADRQAKAKITADGVFLEELEQDPAQYLPEVDLGKLQSGGEIVKVDLNQPMEETLKVLAQYPVATKIAMTGTIIVARDIAHARINDMLEKGEGMPEYMLKYPVYYAGPAKTPAGMPSGSFGPTTAGRMDSYVDAFQAQRGSMIMIGKGNRSKQVSKACKKHGGFYLGSIGGVAATLSQASIKHVEVLDMEELGMEAVWKIQVEDFPAFIIVDANGNDFFTQWTGDKEVVVETDSSFDETKDFFFGLDADGSGQIDVDELAKGLDIELEDAAEIMESYDVDKSGGLDLREFELFLFKQQSYLQALQEKKAKKVKS
jgi:fumarate hydratase class I